MNGRTSFLGRECRSYIMTKMLTFVAITGSLLLSFLASSFSAWCQEGDAKTAVTKVPPRFWEHRGSVLTMEFTRDGDRLVTGGAAHEESVVVWDVKTGQRLLGLKSADIVYSLALSPDGKKIATAGYTNTSRR